MYRQNENEMKRDAGISADFSFRTFTAVRGKRKPPPPAALLILNPTQLMLALMGSSGSLFVLTLCKQCDDSAGFNFSVCACIKAIASID